MSHGTLSRRFHEDGSTPSEGQVFVFGNTTERPPMGKIGTPLRNDMETVPTRMGRTAEGTAFLRHVTATSAIEPSSKRSIKY